MNLTTRNSPNSSKMFIIENLGNTTKHKEENKNDHGHYFGMIALAFLLHIANNQGKEDECPRNQQKSRITIAAIVIYVYKKG